MNSKFYVSLEAEELLKEKGYPFVWGYDSIHPRKVTKAEAIDWLESKGIYIEVFSARIGENRKWCYNIINTKTNIAIETPYKFPTRLEAEESAIIKALKLL